MNTRPLLVGIGSAALILVSSLSAQAQSALPPFQAGRIVALNTSHLPLAAGLAWSYHQGATTLVAGVSRPIHVTIGQWRLEIALHSSQPDARFNVLLTYPVGPYSTSKTHWGKRFVATANAQGNWTMSWASSSQYLTNGKAGLEVVEYAPHQPATVRTLRLRTMTFFPMMFDRSHDLGGNNVIVGTTLHDNSPILSVAGTTYHVNQTLQARLYAWNTVQTTAVELLVQRKEGYAWQTVMSPTAATQPSDTWVVLPFSVAQPGLYRVTYEGNGQVYASTTITVSQ